MLTRTRQSDIRHRRAGLSLHTRQAASRILHPDPPSSNATRTRPHTVIAERRHTYASLARKSGADLRYVQKTMGHSTPTVTANIYSDLYSDELDQVATNLDQLHATEIHTPKTGQEPDESNRQPSA